MKIKNIEGATPIDPDMLSGLIPFLQTQSELNDVEALNIQKATNSYYFKKHKELLTVKFIYKVHRDMFCDVWTWAGKQRKSNTNLGIEKERILQELGVLLGDIKYWTESNTYLNNETESFVTIPPPTYVSCPRHNRNNTFAADVLSLKLICSL